MYLVLLFAALIAQFCQAKQNLCEKIFSHWKKGHYETAIFLSNKHGKSFLAKVIRFDELLQGKHDKFYCACALDFLKKNPDWPIKAELLSKADSLMPRWSDAELIAWCKMYPPRVPTARKRYAIAMARKHGTVPFVVPILRNGWIFGDFNRHQEKEYLRKYGQYIRHADHRARAANLLIFGNKEGALHQAKYLPTSEKEIVLAAVSMLDSSDHRALLTKLCKSKHLLSHELIYLFIRKFPISTAIPKKDLDLVSQALACLGQEKSYLYEWALVRGRVARELLTHKAYKAAYKIVKDAGANSEHFLAGWIAINFLSQPKTALSHFLKMKPDTSSTNGVAKKHYWIARSLFALSRHEEGKSYLSKAAALYNSFYGQVAMETLKRYHFPRTTVAPQAPKDRMQELETISWLNQYGKSAVAAKLCWHLFSKLSKPQIAYALEYLQQEEVLENLNWHYKIGTFAADQGVINFKFLLPRLELDQPAIVEDSLLHAIVKKESSFKPNARSNAGAMGLMQLMAPTAMEVARNRGISLCSKKGIFDPQTNVQIGSLYISSLLGKYSGSYTLALAAYNGGLSRVNRWIEYYGRPKSGNLQSIVNWIESIPFLQTREYVQNVLADRNLYEAIFNNHRRVRISSLG